jgi:DNA-binding response OmpR family regulator
VDLSPLGPNVAEGLRLLRHSSPELQIVVISGSTTALSRDVEADLAGWVRKPFEMDEVISMVARALGRPKASGADVEREVVR